MTLMAQMDALAGSLGLDRNGAEDGTGRTLAGSLEEGTADDADGADECARRLAWGLNRNGATDATWGTAKGVCWG